MRWDRRKKPEGEAIPFLLPALEDGGIERLVRAAKAEEYAAGFREGVATTLGLLLGDDVHGASSYRGEIPDDLRAWAQAARARAAA